MNWYDLSPHVIQKYFFGETQDSAYSLFRKIIEENISETINLPEELANWYEAHKIISIPLYRRKIKNYPQERLLQIWRYTHLSFTWESLSDDVLIYFLSFLDWSTLRNLCCAIYLLFEKAKDVKFWQKLLIEKQIEFDLEDSVGDLRRLYYYSFFPRNKLFHKGVLISENYQFKEIISLSQSEKLLLTFSGKLFLLKKEKLTFLPSIEKINKLLPNFLINQEGRVFSLSGNELVRREEISRPVTQIVETRKGIFYLSDLALYYFDSLSKETSVCLNLVEVIDICQDSKGEIAGLANNGSLVFFIEHNITTVTDLHISKTPYKQLLCVNRDLVVLDEKGTVNIFPNHKPELYSRKLKHKIKRLKLLDEKNYYLFTENNKLLINNRQIMDNCLDATGTIYNLIFITD